MIQKHRHSKRLTALWTALWMVSFAGAPRLVLCVTPDGHHALEVEHPGMQCPTLAGSPDASGISVRPSAKCLDLPAAGTGPAILSSSDRHPVAAPALAFLAGVRGGTAV